MGELVIKEALFKGKSEGDQLFAIFKVLGNFTQSDTEYFQSRVPFDNKLLFREFTKFRR